MIPIIHSFWTRVLYSMAIIVSISTRRKVISSPPMPKSGALIWLRQNSSMLQKAGSHSSSILRPSGNKLARCFAVSNRRNIPKEFRTLYTFYVLLWATRGLPIYLTILGITKIARWKRYNRDRYKRRTTFTLRHRRIRMLSLPTVCGSKPCAYASTPMTAVP